MATISQLVNVDFTLEQKLFEGVVFTPSDIIEIYVPGATGDFNVRQTVSSVGVSKIIQERFQRIPISPSVQQLVFIDKEINILKSPVLNSLLFPGQTPFVEPNEKVRAAFVQMLTWRDFFNIVDESVDKATMISKVFYFNHAYKDALLLNLHRCSFTLFHEKIAGWQMKLDGSNKQLILFISSCFSKNLEPSEWIFPNVHIIFTSQKDRTISRNAYIVDDFSFTELTAPAVRKTILSLNNSSIDTIKKLVESNKQFAYQFELSYCGNKYDDPDFFSLVFGPTNSEDLQSLGNVTNLAQLIDEAELDKRVGSDVFVKVCPDKSFERLPHENVSETVINLLKAEACGSLDLTCEEILQMLNNVAFKIGLQRWDGNLLAKNPLPHPNYQRNEVFDNELSDFMEKIGASQDLFFLFSFCQTIKASYHEGDFFSDLNLIFQPFHVKVDSMPQGLSKTQQLICDCISTHYGNYVKTSTIYSYVETYTESPVSPPLVGKFLSCLLDKNYIQEKKNRFRLSKKKKKF